MLKRRDVLVVGADLSNRKALIRMLDGMSVGAFSCSTVTQAIEVLSSHKVELVFCDEGLPDGTFRDLLRDHQGWVSKPHIAVVVHSGQRAESVKGLKSEGLEVIAFPLHPTDVELAVIRAMREGSQESFFQVSA